MRRGAWKRCSHVICMAWAYIAKTTGSYGSICVQMYVTKVKGGAGGSGLAAEGRDSGRTGCGAGGAVRPKLAKNQRRRSSAIP